MQEALAAEVGSPDNEEAGKQDEAAEETKDAETADEEKQEEKQDDQAAEEEPEAESAAPEDEEQVVEAKEVQEDETEAVEETSEKAAEESEAVMLQKAAAEQMQSIAGIVKPDADEDEDDFAERQMQTPEEMLMHMDLGQHTEKEESELEKR